MGILRERKDTFISLGDVHKFTREVRLERVQRAACGSDGDNSLYFRIKIVSVSVLMI